VKADFVWRTSMINLASQTPGSIDFVYFSFATFASVGFGISHH
jgi:hypothetical protein